MAALVCCGSNTLHCVAVAVNQVTQITNTR